jgi:hypothetical protein
MPISMGLFYLNGGDDRLTHLLYRPSSLENPKGVVVFFPGDISDFAYARMKDALALGDGYSDNQEYNIESLAYRVSHCVPDRYDLVIIKPSAMRGYSSIYSNFLVCDEQGNPINREDETSHERPHGSRYLLSLLHNLGVASHQQLNLDSITMVGFSKGGVVLSGLLREEYTDLISRVRRWVFIDPGLSVPQSTFRAPHTTAPIRIYVSPYQYEDRNRPWLRAEIDEYVSQSGAEIRHILISLPRSVEHHFDSVTVALSLEFYP